ncbi:MAG TPA: protein kinase [Thermoanaerobaculia bacterium]
MSMGPPETRISHYRIEEPLGSGGMGRVYRAVDERLGRRVALKFLSELPDADARQRFIDEARAVSSLDHPNICTIFEVDETADGEIFIAMAYYEGETLERVIARGPMDPGRAASIAIQAGRGLAAAHEELLVHRDIKPANLMLIRRDTVKILDFGLARLLGTHLEGNLIAGTPAYMAPEQLRGEPADPRTDIWSLGVVLYEMLTAKNPFARERGDATINAILRETFPVASRVVKGLPPLADTIVARSLSKDPRARYDRIEDMVSDLAELLADADSGAITLRRPAAAARSSIAVLPFQDMTSASDQQFLCDGIAEEVMNALGRIPDLFVAARTSSFQFKNRAADVREIGTKLGVETVLEGSVRRAGDRLRVTVQLVSVENGYRLWNERYDRDIQDVFAIEEDIAEQIATALRLTLANRRDRRALATTASEAESWQLYLQGRQFFHQQRRKALEIAMQAFQQAIALDPRNARAYAGMADCHSFLHLHFGEGQPAIEAALAASGKALEIAPDSAEARASRGLALFVERDYAGAEDELARAIDLDPRLYDAHYLYGRVCFSEGRIQEAATHFREACSIVREAFDAWYLLGMCYRRLGETSKARTADLECIEAMKVRVRDHPDDTRAWTMGAAVLAELGEPERAADWVGRAIAVDADEPIIQYNAACVYVALGRKDEAIRCLEASVGQGGLSPSWVANDPDLDPLRGDPRFEALVASAKSV